MKETFLLTIFTMLLCPACFTQVEPEDIHEFGKFRSKEFEINRFEKDTTAEAVVLYDVGQSFFRFNDQTGFNVFFEMNEKIKILSDAGIGWANFEIPFYVSGDEMEIVSGIQGFTYNVENNKVEVTPLNVKTIYEEDLSGNWKMKKFAMPNVKKGSLIEIKYTIASPFLFNLRSWTFQKKIPVMYSEYTTRMNPFYAYNFILQGINKFDDYISYQDPTKSSFYNLDYYDMIYSFIMKDVPAFKDEAYITCPEDYLIKQTFQLSEVTKMDGTKESIVGTWPKFVQSVLKLSEIGGYLKNATKNAKDQVKTMAFISETPLEKVQAIDAYMKSNFNWDNHYNKYANKSVKTFLETKIGNSAEINLYYVGLLQAAGIEAFPVILSTRDHGKILLDYPFEHFFNYVVAAAVIDGKYMLLDATEPYTGFGMIPARCINDKGLALKDNKGGFEWINLGSDIKSNVSYNIDLSVDLKTDSVNGSFRVVSNGYEAIDFRKNYTNDIKEFTKSFLSSDMVLKDTFKVTNLREAGKTFEIEFSAKTDMTTFDNKIAISPFLSFVPSANPLRQSSRTYPIDLTYKQGKRLSTTIHIPEGYKLLRSPEKLNIDNENVKLQLTTNMIDDSTLIVVGEYEFKKEIYPNGIYEEIKGYFKKIVSLFNEEVVLEKIKS